eukprot:378905_1
MLFLLAFNLLLITTHCNCQSDHDIDSQDCDKDVEFGHNMLKYFSFDKNLINLNFGSFGSPPILVQQNQSKWRDILNKSPDRWFRHRELKYLNNVQKLIAAYIGIQNWMDLVFIPNASYGCNAILRSLALHLQLHYKTNKTQSFKILYFSTVYPMVSNTLKFINNFFSDSIELITFNITNQMFNNKSLLLSSLELFLINNTNIYASVISHISSRPAVLFDIKSITNVLHKYNILSIIDGAHSIGQIKLNLTDINCDFFVSNGHKWLMSPHGSAIMYIKKEYQYLIYPLIINDGAPSFGNKYIASLDTSEYTQFQRYYNYQGTSDQTAYLAMSAAVHFRNFISKNNDELIINYCHNLVIYGAEIVANIWNTSRLVTNNDNVGNMVNVKLPTQNKTKAYLIRNILFDRNATDEKYGFLWVFEWNGILYCRLSAQIYNDLTDFEWFARVTLQILNDIEQF